MDSELEFIVMFYFLKILLRWPDSGPLHPLVFNVQLLIQGRPQLYQIPVGSILGFFLAYFSSDSECKNRVIFFHCINWIYKLIKVCGNLQLRRGPWICVRPLGVMSRVLARGLGGRNLLQPRLFAFSRSASTVVNISWSRITCTAIFIAGLDIRCWPDKNGLIPKSLSASISTAVEINHLGSSRKLANKNHALHFGIVEICLWSSYNWLLVSKVLFLFVMQALRC